MQSLLGMPLIRTAYSLWLRRRGYSLEELIQQFAHSREKGVYFVQIGANDGVRNDPYSSVIRQFQWRGICVEPQSKAFSLLESYYQGNESVSVENAAVSDRTGTQTMFRISFSDEFWASAITSLRRDILQKHIDCGYVEAKAKANGVTLPEKRESWISEVSVPTITFADLLAKHQMPRIDALFVDVEGYEWPILSQFNFSKYKPAFIALESAHLSPEDRDKILRKLKANGYQLRKTSHEFVFLL